VLTERAVAQQAIDGLGEGRVNAFRDGELFKRAAHTQPMAASAWLSVQTDHNWGIAGPPTVAIRPIIAGFEAAVCRRRGKERISPEKIKRAKESQIS
jgi:hypothetical protein